jgi:hypothetical protein
MSRGPAKFTQADVERVIRAAKRQGLAVATVKMPDGTEFKFDLSPQSTEGDGSKPKAEVVL